MPLEILLAEDEPTLREVLGDVLEEGGHRVTRCADGSSASGLLRRGRFDLLVTDVRLPGPDGYELATQALGRNPPY